MLENKTKVLLIVSQDILDRAREDHPALLANIAGQATVVRQKRAAARRARGPEASRGPSGKRTATRR